MIGEHAATAVAFVGAAVVFVFVVYGLGIESRAYLSEPLLGAAAGILLGPAGLGVITLDIADPHHAEIVTLAAGLIAGLTIMSAALTLSPGFLGRHWRSLSLILTVGMVGMWLLSTAVAALVLPVSLLGALLVGAMVTPTDPVLASTIVTGRIASANVPKRLRDAIMAESAINDGLAIPFVALATMLLTPGFSGLEYLGRLFVELGGAFAIGLVAGAGAGAAVRSARAADAMETESMVPVVVSLTVAILAFAHAVGSDALLAVFVAGIAFRRALAAEWSDTREHFTALVERIAAPVFFLVFGALIPWDDWAANAGPLAALAALTILLRRPPVFMLLGRWTPVYKGLGERAFASWFGPVGVAAVFYAAQAVGKVDVPLLWPAVSAVVAASLVVHGLTSTPLTQRLPFADNHNTYLRDV